MTMKVFLGFPRKPAKSPASAVSRAFGMTEQPSDDGNWIFAKGRFRIRLEDLRTDLQPEHREWADDVGWVHNWAVSIAVHHRGRTDVDYIKWHGLVAVIMEAYELNILWTDSGTDTPQYHMRLDDFVTTLKSESADDLSPDEEEPVEEEVSEPVETAEEPIDIPDSVLDQLIARRMDERKEESPPKEEQGPKEDKVVLQPVEESDDDDDDFDSFDDWDDDEDDDETEEVEEDLGPITDW